MRQNITDDQRIGRRQQVAQRGGDTAKGRPAERLVKHDGATHRSQAPAGQQRQRGVELNADETGASRGQRREDDAVAAAEVGEHVAGTESEALGEAAPLRTSKTAKRRVRQRGPSGSKGRAGGRETGREPSRRGRGHRGETAGPTR